MRLMWICWCEGKPSGNQNKILPKFGHFHFAQSCLKICHFLDFSPTFEIKYRMLAKYLRFDVYLLFQVSLAVTNEVHTQLGAAIRVLVVLELKKGTHLLSSLPPKVTRYLSEGEKARASTFTLWRVKVVWAFLAAKSQTITSAVKPMCVNWKSGALGKLGTLKIQIHWQNQVCEIMISSVYTCPEATYLPLLLTARHDTSLVCPDRNFCSLVFKFSMTTVQPRG